MAMSYPPETAALREKMLRKRLWIVISKAVATPEQLATKLHDHLQHQIRLEKEGHLFGAGPLSNEDGSPTGLGMIVLRASSAEEARMLADRDPFHSSGMRSYTLQQWSLNEGRMNVTIDFSDQSYKFA
jgi:uncharacterized protein YciI